LTPGAVWCHRPSAAGSCHRGAAPASGWRTRGAAVDQSIGFAALGVPGGQSRAGSPWARPWLVDASSVSKTLCTLSAAWPRVTRSRSAPDTRSAADPRRSADSARRGRRARWRRASPVARRASGRIHALVLVRTVQISTWPPRPGRHPCAESHCAANPRPVLVVPCGFPRRGSVLTRPAPTRQKPGSVRGRAASGE